MSEKNEVDQKKLYVYVDESGQDTQGELFVVGIVVVEDPRTEIEKELKAIEESSQKGRRKWIKTREQQQKAYISKLLVGETFKERMFYAVFENRTDYLECTALAVSWAISDLAQESDYKATVLVDGLQKAHTREFGSRLRRLEVKTKKVRGIRDEGTEPILRLADAICGFARDSLAGKKHLIVAMQKATRKDYLKRCQE